jgi:hypothetical protein
MALPSSWAREAVRAAAPHRSERRTARESTAHLRDGRRFQALGYGGKRIRRSSTLLSKRFILPDCDSEDAPLARRAIARRRDSRHPRL